MKQPRKKVPNLIEAMNAPELFRPWFRGDSWNNWRSVLKATAALPMTDDEIEFFKSVAGGREPPRRRPRENWFVVGRRGGKDSIVSVIAEHVGATFNPKGMLRPGERALIACIAPDRETAKIIQRYIRAFFEEIPALAKMMQRVTDDVVELTNSVDIAVLTGNFRTVRGRPILAAVLDEVALLRSDDSAAPDVELYAALLPGMATIPQAQMFGISSPYAKAGLLYKKHTDHFGKDSDDVLVIQAPSHTMNPILDTRDRDRQMQEDPARARAEWYAEFRDDLVAFIDPVTVNRCVIKGRTVIDPARGVTYVAAVDPSGGSSDSMTLAIAHADSSERGILDYVGEWPAPFSPQQVVKEIVGVLERYGIKAVTGDRYAGEWAREPFRNHGVEYQLSDHTRSEAYLTLLPAINSGKVELLDHARMISQLCALERHTARSGRDSVDHPRGSKDDVINAAALALVGAALAPKSSAENWIEFYRRQSERGATDVDAIRAAGPAFGFSFVSEPFVVVSVPNVIAAEGAVYAPRTGNIYSVRRVGAQSVAEMRRADAAELFKSNAAWASLNSTLAGELGLNADEN